MKADGHTGRDIAKYLGVSRGDALPVPHRGCCVIVEEFAAVD